METTRRPPVLFSLSRRMIRAGVPGGYRLWSALHARGALDRIVRYEIGGPARSVPIYVPLGRSVSSWSAREIGRYEHRVIRLIAEEAARLGGAFRLADCGADIGMVTTALLRASAQIEEVTALEPNEEAFAVLTRTLAAAPVPARAVGMAVGDRTGRVRLVTPTGQDAHAAYVELDEAGPISLTRLDDVLAADGRGLVLKIDVEGGEDAVVAGASGLLAATPRFVVAFEAHRGVAARTGRDPGAVLRRLAGIAPIRVRVAEMPGLRLDPVRGLFAQVDAAGGASSRVLNVVASTERD